MRAAWRLACGFAIVLPPSALRLTDSSVSPWRYLPYDRRFHAVLSKLGTSSSAPFFSADWWAMIPGTVIARAS